MDPMPAAQWLPLLSDTGTLLLASVAIILTEAEYKTYYNSVNSVQIYTASQFADFKYVPFEALIKISLFNPSGLAGFYRHIRRLTFQAYLTSAPRVQVLQRKTKLL